MLLISARFLKRRLENPLIKSKVSCHDSELYKGKNERSPSLYRDRLLSTLAEKKGFEPLRQLPDLLP